MTPTNTHADLDDVDVPDPYLMIRRCVICDVSILVSLYSDGSYDGGHYFNLNLDGGREYWECDDCYYENGSS